MKVGDVVQYKTLDKWYKGVLDKLLPEHNPTGARICTDSGWAWRKFNDIKEMEEEV